MPASTPRSCCSDLPPLALDDLDLALPLDVLPALARWIDEERLATVVHRPTPAGWDAWPMLAHELVGLGARAGEAWIVQRPGCGGLVSRLVLLDVDRAPLACVAAARAPGAPEPA